MMSSRGQLDDQYGVDSVQAGLGFEPLTIGFQGKVKRDADMARYSWFRTGGKADLLVEPRDESDLRKILNARPDDLPVTIIGGGSNVLVRDGGIRGLTVHLGKDFQTIRQDGTKLVCGAGALDIHIARFAEERSIAGLSFLVGIPGTIGGAIAMNAGAFGGEFAEIYKSARGMDMRGRLVEYGVAELDFDYRESSLPRDVLITSVTLQGRAGDRAEIAGEMKNIMAERSLAQPGGVRTGGSTFKNPKGYKAWQLIDQAGCRGFAVGDAQMSEKHCNFMINNGKATAADLDYLMQEVKARVYAKTGIELQPEIRMIGEAK